MQKALDVITIGEAMAMFVATETGELAEVEHFMKRVAGAELNVATGLARLGLSVGWVSRVGADSFGRFVLTALAKEGIDARGVSTDGRYATGFQLKSKVENGTDPIVEYFRKGSAASHLSPDDFNESYFASARHLHLSGVAAALSESSYALLDRAARTMKAQGKTISFDPNLRPTLWKSEAEMVEKLNRLAFQADWVLPGLKEGMIMIKVDNVVDTVGAGDGFAVGVISALLEGKPLPQAVKRGNKIGSLAIQVQGDSEGLPTREALGE